MGALEPDGAACDASSALGDRAGAFGFNECRGDLFEIREVFDPAVAPGERSRNRHALAHDGVSRLRTAIDGLARTSPVAGAACLLPTVVLRDRTGFDHGGHHFDTRD
jgi:hypothetical protein